MPPKRAPARPPTPYFAIVRWNDAHSIPGQIDDASSVRHAPLRVHTSGWVIQDDADGLTVFGERIDQGDGSLSWRQHGFIPRGMIEGVTVLTETPS
jgi:hypothetical protein